MLTLSTSHLELAADALGSDDCYVVDGRFHFMLDDSTSVALKSEAPGRIRVDIYRLLVRAETVGWTFSQDRGRLVELVRDARSLHALQGSTLAY